MISWLHDFQDVVGQVNVSASDSFDPAGNVEPEKHYF